MATNHILLLGAHGQIAKMMISKFLANSWSVTALIRNGDEDQKKKQKDELQKIGDEAPKTNNNVTLDVLFHNLSEVKTTEDAAEVIKRASAAKPVNWIVWSAGSGGNPGPNGESKGTMTIAVDARAAIAFADAATHNKQIERYLTISAINARHSVASWWGKKKKDGEKSEAETMVDAGKIPDMKVYTEAKTVADHCLTVWGEERRKKDPTFKYVVLRPGRLVTQPLEYEDEKVVERIHLGKATGGKTIKREAVAHTAVELLKKDANGWFDLLEAEKQGGTIEKEVQRVISEKETSIEGEDADDMKEMKESIREWPQRLENFKKQVESNST